MATGHDASRTHVLRFDEPEDNTGSSSPSCSPTQYATYPSNYEAQAPIVYQEPLSDDVHSDSEKGHSSSQEAEKEKPWVPLFLQRWFWITYIIVLVGLSVGLEVAYAIGRRKLGWDAKTSFSKMDSYMNYVISLPPVIVAMGIVAVWVSTDVEIKKLQPYIDLVEGNAPAHRSLLLNYARYNPFLVWFNAAANRHTLVFLATIMALLTLTFQPLASALLEIRDTYVSEGAVVVKGLGSLALNQDTLFQDLTYFLTASNFAAASVLYNLPDPTFIYRNYAVAPFTVPHDIATNGTVHASTLAVRSEPNCTPMETVKVRREDGSGWDVSGLYEGCSMNWSVDKNTTTLFGTGTPTCPSGVHANITSAFLPVIFWFFTYQPAALASATFCNPTISLHNVNVTIDLGSSNVTSLVEVGTPTIIPPGLSFAPRAYNGISFDHLPDNVDRFISGRRDAIQLQMPSAMLQAAIQSKEQIVSFFENNSFVDLSQKVYTIYMNLIAKSVYFVPVEDPISTQVWAWRKRVWLSTVSTHLLTAGMLLLAVIATYIHIQHETARRNLILFHEPGSIASAVSFGAQTGMGALLAREAPQSEKQFKEVLKDKRFRIDPATKRILMEGEAGYETATTPRTAELMQRRKSVFAAFQRQKLGETPVKPPN